MTVPHKEQGRGLRTLPLLPSPAGAGNSTRLANRLVAIVENTASFLSYARFTSEAQPQCELNLAGRRRGHRDDAELRRVDKALWHIEVGVIEGIEELRPEL